MKKIIAIIVVSIAVTVTGYNIYENLPQFTVKPDTGEKVRIRESRGGGAAKGFLATYISFNAICLIYLFVEYEIYRKKTCIEDHYNKREKTNFYKDALTDILYGSIGLTAVCFGALRIINGLVVFGIITWLIYLLIA